MPKTLVVVESPTKSKTIEKILGRNYVVRASMGHLRDLPKTQFGVDIENNFEPKYINIRGKGPLIKELKSLAKKADRVYLATDPDREGEAIAWHLAHILDVAPEDNCRIAFHEITSKAVKDAIKTPKPIDLDKVDAQQTRRILDRIVGYKLSPLLWRKIRKGLSAGRVQSVAVKLICDRQREIDAFVPQEYWTLHVKLREKSKAPQFLAEVVKYKEKKLEITTAQEAEKAATALQTEHYTVKDTTKKLRKNRPSAPFTTSSLQQEAFKKYNFTTKKTMMLAQQLYEGINLGKEGSVGLITYMRTDSVRFSDEAITSIREYLEEAYGKNYVPAKPHVYSSKKNAQDAHEAIRPSSVQRLPESLAAILSKDQLKLYTLIWKRAVASQMAEAVSEVTSLSIAAGDYLLTASGSVLQFDGYQKLSDKKDLAKEKTKLVPFLEKGTIIQEHEVEEPKQHFTEPKPYFTEASLVKELEENGIGRPSTYAPTVQTILERSYIVKDGKKLVPTELGFLTLELLTNYFSNLINIPFSARLEEQLDEVAESKLQRNFVLSTFYEPFAKALAVAEKEIPVVELPVEVSDIACEKCGRMMVYKQGRFGKFLACPGFPDCRNTKPILKKIGVKCPLCKTGEIIERKSKRGRIFFGCEHYPECTYTSWDKPTEIKCPKCSSVMVEKRGKNGKKLLQCSNTEECKYSEEQVDDE
ncbi:MAG TPA: type I DNA topoisomerase [Candidatus Avacidaminococcus intestinavium]|uniref:DNA topoisomerase 1 n=1 Tax=Candidatus Avacidaminococcus intestinavium TaxID=2840684 RepID=A0A9D1SLW0_9FIRM|nr:type I DNA topoisomerase [Candidatus Avacidaminococcus intestinavium]